VFNVLVVGYSLAKNNLNNTYQYNMIPKNFSKTINQSLFHRDVQGEKIKGGNPVAYLFNVKFFVDFITREQNKGFSESKFENKKYTINTTM
jgi:hypothetical protein